MLKIIVQIFSSRIFPLRSKYSHHERNGTGRRKIPLKFSPDLRFSSKLRSLDSLWLAFVYKLWVCKCSEMLHIIKWKIFCCSAWSRGMKFKTHPLSTFNCKLNLLGLVTHDKKASISNAAHGIEIRPRV